jgi:hypothetical protein
MVANETGPTDSDPIPRFASASPRVRDRLNVPKPVSDPSLQQMPRPVVLKVAPLAPGPEVPRRVPAGVVIQVRSRQNDARHSLLGHVL